MTVMNWPNELLTLSDWDALPEDDGFRSELVEGVLVVSPRPILGHQQILGGLYLGLQTRLPPHLTALLEVDVVLFEDPATVRAPDLVITPSQLVDSNSKRLKAADVCFAVEILSPGTVRTDRVMKFSEYADAGIENYWMIVSEPSITLTAYRLAGGRYELVGTHSGSSSLVVGEYSIALDLDSLTSRFPS